jgi:hypothetical protein
MRQENVTTYVRFRGDLSFKESPFNEIDALIFTLLSYIDFKGIASYEGSITLKEASEKVVAIETGEPVEGHHNAAPHELELLNLAGQSKRFGETKITYFVDELDNEEVRQFCAMHFVFEKNASFVAFRGTDDTLVGWKENFQMLYANNVAGQVRAARYLSETCLHDLKHLFMKYYVGGHSKGGNIAVYGVLHCDEPAVKKIAKVYSFDGPGFEQPFEEMPRYQEIKDKLETYTPKFSAIGFCLDHYRLDHTVDSFYNGLYQHDGYSWIVEGTHFKRAERDEDSKRVEANFKEWVHSIPIDHRESFVNALFEVLEESGCNSISDFLNLNMSRAINIMKKMINIPSEERDLIIHIFLFVINEDRKSKQTVDSRIVEKVESFKENLTLENIKNIFNTQSDKPEKAEKAKS